MKNNDTIVMTTQAHHVAKELNLSLPRSASLRLIEENLVSRLAGWGLRSRHDDINAACAAIAASSFLKVPEGEALSGIASFRGLEHRCQIIRTTGNVRWINDSKATNVDSTLSALKSLNQPTLLLLGGQGKGESFAPIKKYRDVISSIYAFGQARKQIRDDLGDDLVAKSFNDLATCLGSLRDSFPNIQSDVLLSPGCASFDEFRDFEHRGQFFAEFVNELNF